MVSEREKYAWGQGYDVPTTPYTVVNSKEEVVDGHEASHQESESRTEEVGPSNHVAVWGDGSKSGNPFGW
jgi:hypothetical protein